MSETPVEDFIREAAVWVDKDGQTYFEMVMSTVYELERRFTAERRRAEEADKFCEIFKKSQIEFEKRIEDLECRLDVALKSAEQWRKEALRLNNVEPPSITVPHDNLTREMRFNLCLKMIDQMNQVELDNLIRELNKK